MATCHSTRIPSFIQFHYFTLLAMAWLFTGNTLKTDTGHHTGLKAPPTLHLIPRCCPRVILVFRYNEEKSFKMYSGNVCFIFCSSSSCTSYPTLRSAGGIKWSWTSCCVTAEGSGSAWPCVASWRCARTTGPASSRFTQHSVTFCKTLGGNINTVHV